MIFLEFKIWQYFSKIAVFKNNFEASFRGIHDKYMCIILRTEKIVLCVNNFLLKVNKQILYLISKATTKDLHTSTYKYTQIYLQLCLSI